MRAVFQDGTISLIVQFTNGLDEPIDPTSGPIVSIFDPNNNPLDTSTLDGDATVLDASEVSRGTGLQVGTNLIEHLGVGLYRYKYVLAPDSIVGSWFDRWEATVDGAPLEMTFNFDVVEKSVIESISLQQNMEITVTLDESIADIDGNTLGDDYEFIFSTILSPFYSSADLLSLEIGSFLVDIPRYTLDLAIHWASIEADANTFRRRINISCGPARNNEYFEFIRTQYVLCRAAHMLIANATNSNMKSKKLADLEVVYDNSINDRLLELLDHCAELRRILNSNGTIGLGTSLPLAQGIKGGSVLDRPGIGRDWIQLQNVRPGANTKTLFRGHTRPKRHWQDKNSKG